MTAYGLGLALVIGAWVHTLAPWWSMPDTPRATIDARWAMLEEWARPRLPAGDPRLVVAAASAAGEGQGGRALDLLVVWDRGGGGIGDDPCAPRLGAVFELFEVVKVGVAGAGSPEDPRIHAALRLGATLRDHGGMISTLVGEGMYVAVLDRFEEAGWAPSSALLESRLREGDVPVILARDAVCDDRWYDEALTRGALDLDHLAYGDFEHFIALFPVDAERERLHLRAYLGEVVERAVAAPGPDERGAALSTPPREAAPASLITRDAITEREWFVHQYLERVEEIDARLAELEARAVGAG